MSGIEIPDEPTGIGSIIRVVFKEPLAGAPETFYIGALPGLWVEYGSDGVDEFTWDDMEYIIKYDEADEFEVVYEGFGAAEMGASRQHPKDWIWKAGL